MRRRWLVFSLIFVILVMGVCGCSMEQNNKQISEQQIIAEMKNHLSDKYGNIEYDVKGFIASGWDHPYDVLNLVTIVDGLEESFRVERHENEGKYVYKDNYFGVVIREEFENQVIVLAEKYFPEFKVFAGMQSHMYPDSLNGDSNLEDMLAIKDEIGSITFIVLVNEKFGDVEEFNDAAKAFILEWSELKIPSTPRIIYLLEDVYKTMDRSNYSDVLVANRITEYSERVK